MNATKQPAVPSLAHLFYRSEANYGPHPMYMSKRNDVYRALTYEQVGVIIRNLALGLASLGVKKDDKVSILCPTQEEWAMADFAILSLGAVTVPIYPNLPSKQVEYIVHNSDSKVIFVSDQEQLAKVIEVKSNCPALTHVVLVTADDKKKDYVIHFSELQETGKKFGGSHQNYIEDALSKISPKDLATIIYTSGTTGMPKGVMLSHNNLISNSQTAVTVAKIGPEDTFLSFLPLAHVFERMAGHFMPISQGCAIAYAESIEKVPQNMGEVRPTIMCAVPRLYEKIYNRVQEGLQTAPAIRKKIFAWAIRVGEEARRTGKKGFSYKLAHKLVYTKLHARFGGRLRIFVSGGAPLSKEVGEFFAHMGMMILEGYGLTETSPIITVNRPALFKLGTVGCVIDGVEARIAPDGEILTRGPHVMLGYYKNPEATKEMIDADGWLHTGDIGYFDQDNYLVITDRKKNLIVTSGGKNVAPQPIETLLVTIPYIEQVMVIGDNRNFISALVVPNLDQLRKYAKDHNIAYNSDDQLIANKDIYAMVEKLMQETQEHGGIARYEQVRKFAFLPKAFTIESGELTPTLKIKRNVITQNFVHIIESIYNKETEKLNEKDSTN